MPFILNRACVIRYWVYFLVSTSPTTRVPTHAPFWSRDPMHACMDRVAVLVPSTFVFSIMLWPSIHDGTLHCSVSGSGKLQVVGLKTGKPAKEFTVMVAWFIACTAIELVFGSRLLPSTIRVISPWSLLLLQFELIEFGLYSVSAVRKFATVPVAVFFTAPLGKSQNAACAGSHVSE